MTGKLPFYPDDLLKSIEKLFQDLEQDEQWGKYEKTQHHDLLIIDLKYDIGRLRRHVSALSFLLTRTMSITNDIVDAINKLPDKSEFNEVKATISTQAEKIETTLMPIRDAIKKEVEFQKKKVDYIG